MTQLATDPRLEFERRYAYQALESAIARGEPEIIVRGARGTGKTMMNSDLFYRLALKYPGMTQVWMRKERSKMTNSVLATFEDEVLGIGHPLRSSGANREGRRGYDVGNGSRILLIGMDDIDSTKSVSADLFWVNECSQFTEAEWEEIGAAARPRVGVTGFNFQCKIGDCNPMPPAHWTNSRCMEWPRHLYPRVKDDGTLMGEWFTPAMYCEAAELNLTPLDRAKAKAKLIVSFHADNPGYWSIDPWGWAPPGLKYVYDQLGRLTGNRKARYLEGRPVAVEGVVFDDFNREKHVLEVGPGKAFPNGIGSWPVVISYDPGFSHPCAVVFWATAPNGRHFIVDEIHGSEIPLIKLGPMIREKAAQYRIVRWLDDPKGANQRRQESNGRTVRDIMRDDHRLFFRPWQAAEGRAKQAQVEAVRDMLLADPPLQVFSTCTGVIGEFESWKNKTNTRGELVEGDDAYEDRNNDAMDAICGIVASRPKYEEEGITMLGAPKKPAYTIVNGRKRWYSDGEDDDE